MSTTPKAKAPLNSLPYLDCRDIYNAGTETNAPFPGEGRVFKDLVVDDRDIHDGEHDEEARGDSDEEEAVSPDGGEDG